MYAGLSVILSSALCRNSTIIALIKQSVPWAQKELRMKVVSASGSELQSAQRLCLLSILA